MLPQFKGLNTDNRPKQDPRTLRLAAQRRMEVGFNHFAVGGSSLVEMTGAIAAEWCHAAAELDAGIAKLRFVRDFTARCNAAYGSGGDVDRVEAARLQAEFLGLAARN